MVLFKPGLISFNLDCSISISCRTYADLNSKKISMELAQSTLTLFDTTLDDMVLDAKKSLDELLIPIYSQPKPISTVLPGKINNNVLCVVKC